MATFKVSRVETKPYDGQKPGTSGLRKKVKVFAQPHYLQNVVQSSFNALTADRIKGKTRVISGDGRYYSGHAIQATTLRQPTGRFTILSFQSSHNAPSSKPSISSLFTSSVGSPPTHLSHLRLSQRHVTTLNILACAVAISATWLFCSAIPALLAFKRAAESLEKLLDVTREELPDTMAAVRLSGMEISDLTMELSDLGQEITQGVRKSTRAVHMAEDKLRHFAQITSAAPMQEIVSTKITTTVEPALATTSRSIREGIVKGRAVLQSFFALIGFSRLVSNYFSSRSNNK